MMKKQNIDLRIRKMMMVVVLMVASLQALAQGGCDLTLRPEGNNLCVLERHTDNLTLVRACRGNTVSYRAYSSTAIGYEWTVVGGTHELSGDGTECMVKWGEGNTGMVQVEAMKPDSSVCVSTIMVMLEDKPSAGLISAPNYVVNVDGDGKKWIEVCAGDSLWFEDNSSSGERPIVDYYWGYPWGVSNSRLIAFEARTPGEYEVMHRVYNECGCYDEEVVTLIVLDKCPLELSCFGAVCANTQSTYTATSPKCTDYLWNVEGGTIVRGQHSQNIIVQWGEPESGFGMLYLDGASCDCECKSRKSIKVPVISGNVSMKGPDTICVDNTYDYTLPLWGATQYEWSVEPTEGVVATATGNKLRLRADQKMDYVITVTYSCDFLGCGPYSMQKEIHVREPLEVTASPSAEETCIGAMHTFATNAEDTCDWTVERNGDIVHQETGVSMDYGFGASGLYEIKARHADRCDEARMTVRVKDNPPPPRDLEGPDTICPGFAAEYSATSSSDEYYIEWEWVVDGDTHTYTGNKVTIQFGNTVEGIRAYQVSRRTGCRSEAAEKAVGAFVLAEWPYDDIVRFCQGQKRTLTRLRDQSADDVLYEWKVKPANVLSIQGDHLRADVELMANYAEELPTTTQLILERQFCDNKQYDTAIVRIGEIEMPEIRHGEVCAGVSTRFTVRDMADADQDQTYWAVDGNEQQRGAEAWLTFDEEGGHEVHLHYVTRQGCEADAYETVFPCGELPPMQIIEDRENGVLSVDIVGGDEGYRFEWMNGATTPWTNWDGGRYSCTVTSLVCGCTETLTDRGHTSPQDCTEVDGAFDLEPLCYNIIKITPVAGSGLGYPFTAELRQGNQVLRHTITQEHRHVMVPSIGDYSVKVSWTHDGECYTSTEEGYVEEAVTLTMENDCMGNLVISGEGWDGEQMLLTAQVERQSGTMEPLTATGHNRVSVQMRDTGWFWVRVTYGTDADCYVDTLVHFDPLPTIERMDVRDMMCEQTAFAHQAEATGEGLTYRWNFGDGSWNFGNELDHVYESSDSYVITLAVTDRNGCTCTRSMEASVGVNNIRNIELSQSTHPNCPGQDIAITVENEDSELDADHNSFAWAPCSQFTGNQAMVDRTGTYMVEVTTNEMLCRKQREINVAYPNGPTAHIQCDSSYCLHDEVRLIGDVGSGFAYRWTIQSANIDMTAGTGNVDLHLADTGYYQVTLTMTDGNGCSDSDEKRFYVHNTPAAPIVGFCGNKCITEGPVELCSEEGRELLWSNGGLGTSALYYTDGTASAYYIEEATGCSSHGAYIQIPEAPEMAGLLTGCYCLRKQNLPTEIPLYTLGNQGTMMWEWVWDNNPTSNGTLPPSPAMLPIPMVGDYWLEVPDYGMGCATESPRLTIETNGCNYESGHGSGPGPGERPTLWGYVLKKTCEQTGCVLTYSITMSICNRGEEVVCIDNLYPSLPLAYTVASGIPMTLNTDECQDVSVVVQYNYTNPSEFAFVLECLGERVGYVIVSLSDWMDCVDPDTCTVEVTPTLVVDSTLSQRGQSVFFRLGMAFPSLTGNVISVGCEQGQIIDGAYSGGTYSGLLMVDYGLMSQMVADSADFCFRIVCCDNGSICTSMVCIPYRDLWDICGMLGAEDRTKPAKAMGEERERRFVLVPNPATNVVWVEDAEGPTGASVRKIEVFALNGLKVMETASRTQIDVSRFATGSYIVKVETTDGGVEYLKMVKK